MERKREDLFTRKSEGSEGGEIRLMGKRLIERVPVYSQPFSGFRTFALSREKSFALSLPSRFRGEEFNN
jgi:hypothetical protein